MRLLRVALALSLVVAAAEACSLVIPFDEYPGVEGPADARSTVAADARDDGAIPPPDAAACPGKDLLTDPSNCGECGRECVVREGAERSCAGGRCALEELIDGGGIIRGLTAGSQDPAGADDGLFFVREGLVNRITLADFRIESGDAAAPKATGPISVDRGSAFGVYAGQTQLVRFEVPAITKPSTLNETTVKVDFKAVLAEGSLVFWADGDAVGVRNYSPPGFGSKQFEAGSPVRALAPGDGKVFWVVDDGRVIQANATNPEQPAEVVASGATGSQSLAVSGNHLAVGQAGQGVYFYTLTETGGGTLVRKVDMADPKAIVADGVHFYVFNHAGAGVTDGQVIRMGLDGAERLVIAAGLNTPQNVSSLTLAGPHLYIVDGARLSRTTK